MFFIKSDASVLRRFEINEGIYLAKFERAYAPFWCFVEDLVRNLGVKIARRLVGFDRWMSLWYDSIDDNSRRPYWGIRMYLAELLGCQRDIR